MAVASVASYGDDELSWDTAHVARVEAVELVGETRRSDAEINEIGRFGRPISPCRPARQTGLTRERLRNEWGEYLVAWWNCQDYSIRLAHIVMAGSGGGLARDPILGDLMGLLATCRSKLIITRAGFLGVTATACFMAGPVGAMGAAALYAALSVGVAIPQRKREQVVRVEFRLETQFPELRTLRISPSRLGRWMNEEGVEMWWRRGPV